MFRAFIIRPFGVKHGVDFDAVEEKLVGPALDSLGIGGRTTGEILEAGNIREDMFRLLLTADLVVADISIGNPNVYYELGIRHALRDRHTFLIRSRAQETPGNAGGNDVPFDLKTDRYFAYDNKDPEASLAALTQALRVTLASENSNGGDSPVFKLLPGLGVGDWIRFLHVPEGFREAVRRAERECWIGDLILLAEEAENFSWSLEGWRTVGVSLLEARQWRAAQLLWEKVRARFPEDAQAYRHLATIYQKNGDLPRSDESVDQLLRLPDLTRRERAEAWALRGSNAKTRWIAEWQGADEDRREEVALRSPDLETARNDYRTGYIADQNHSYSGLNALSLLHVSVDLAERHPDIWTLLYDSDDEAADALAELKADEERLSQALHLSIVAEERALELESLQTDSDPDSVADEQRWLEFTKADLRFLTQDIPERVVHGYRRALQGAPAFNAESLLRQLRIFADLGVRKENADAVIGAIEARDVGGPAEEPEALPQRVLVFTGHRLDVEGREVPRFPPSPEAVAKARAMIRDAVAAEVADAEGATLLGLAGGASGGDILFHEVCAELNVPTHLYLLADRDNFVRTSVADAGGDWVARFDRLCAALPTRVLQDGPMALELPNWLLSLRSEYSVWQRNNHWLMNAALAYGSESVKVIALWDGKKRGDGEGGTSDMVALAQERGCVLISLDAGELVKAAQDPSAPQEEQ